MTTHAPGQGRRPKPTALKLLTGADKKHPERLNDREPRLEPGLPPAPRELTPRAKREWRRLGRLLLAANIPTELDALALGALCQSYARWIEAQEAIARTGLLVRGDKGIPRINPLLAISRDCQAEYTRLLTEFGMTPSSRSRIRVEKAEEVDEFEALMRRNA